MIHVRLTAAAETDIRLIAKTSEQRFGGSARNRYLALIAQAIRDLAETPNRPGRLSRPGVGKDIYSYHLSLSRDHVRPEVGRVHTPRHILFYQSGPDHITILRLLHDSMDFARHLPPS